MGSRGRGGGEILHQIAFCIASHAQMRPPWPQWRRDGASVLWSGSRRTGEAVRQAQARARREAESRRERGSQHIDQLRASSK